MADEELDVKEQESTSEEELSAEEKLMARLKEAIAVEREPLGALREKLSIRVPREVLDDRLGEQLAELKRDAFIPGFRKGHAPLKLVEKRFGADVGEELKTQVVSSAYLAAVEKEALKPLGDPMIWVRVKEDRTGEDGKTHKVDAERLMRLDRALEEIVYPKEGDLSFACEIELKPDFELPSLEKIRVEKPTVSIDDDDIDTEIDRLRMRGGTYHPVEGGSIEADDLLYADVKVTVGGETLMSEKNVEMAARDLRIMGVPAVGLGQALLGKKQGDTVSVSADVPDDHEKLEIRGQKATFEVAVHEIKRLELPALDAEFVTGLGFESEKELRGSIRTNMEAELDQIVTRRMKEQVSEYLVDNTKLEIPEGLSQRQTDRSVARRMIDLYQAGVPEAEIKKTVDELRVKAHDQAVRDLKLYFILEKIAEAQNIDVPEERFNAAIAEIAKRTNRRFDRVRDELSKGDGLTTLFISLRDGEVLDRLLADAEVVQVEGPKKKSAKKTPSKPRAAETKGAAKKTAKKKTTKKSS